MFYCSKFERTFCKFAYLISLVLTNVFFKGFCHPDKKDENGGKGENDNEGATELIEGTGIGEGKAKRKCQQADRI